MSTLLCATSIASADPVVPASPIEWQAPRGCPRHGELVARVEARLGTPLPASTPRMRVIVRRTEGVRLRATVWKVTESGQGTEPRSLTAVECGSLADAIAVVIARQAADTVVAEAPEEPDAQPYESEEPPDASVVTSFPASRAVAPRPLFSERPEPVPHVPPPRSVADVALTPAGFGARMLAVSGVGTVPGVGLGGELAVFARRRSIFGELALTRWAKRASEGGLSTEPAEVGLDVVGARVGYVPAHTLLRAWAVTEVGRWTSSYEMPARAHLAVGAGAAVAWPIADQIRVVGVFETTLTLVQNPFETTPGGPEIHRPSAGAARCSLGVELGWW